MTDSIELCSVSEPSVPILQHGVGELSDAPAGYVEWLIDVKARVRASRVQAVRAANTVMLRLYWSIGKDILDRQLDQGWGSGVVRRLSSDMRLEFPGESGWSESNLRYMRRVASVWPTEAEFLHHVGGELPWGHITVLLDRLSTREERDWYAARTVTEGWKRSVLEHFIRVDLRHQLGAAPTNFQVALRSPDSELAQQIVKDPYVFEHLSMTGRISEREVEDALIDRLQDTLIEFGRGMAFVGRQVHLTVVDRKGRSDDLVPDLILFHIPQARYVVVELKVGDFEPGFLSQLGTYVGIVDAQLRDPDKHAPTIGMLLCTGKNEAVAQFALASMAAPVGIADYSGLPPDAKATLPPVAEIQAALADLKETLEKKTERVGEIPG